MANLIKYIPTLQSGFEECRQLDQLTNWMEGNARPDMIKWISPRKFIVQTLNIDGLGDYPANCDCFPTGGFEVDNKTFELGFRRAVKFCWNRADDMDTDGIVTASNLLRVLRTRQVVPEVDRFRISKLAGYATQSGNANTGTYATPQDAVEAIRAEMQAITESGLYAKEELVILISSRVKGIVNMMYGSCCPSDPSKDTLKNEIGSIDGARLIEIPAGMMKTSWIYNSGFDGTFGFQEDPAAKDINWIIVPRSAPAAIVRYNKWKAFDPDGDRCADNWELLYDMYHDLWVNQCDLEGMSINTTT